MDISISLWSTEFYGKSEGLKYGKWYHLLIKDTLDNSNIIVELHTQNKDEINSAIHDTINNKTSNFLI